MLDIDKLIRTEPGAIYRITIGYRPGYSVYTCKAGAENTQSNNSEGDGDYYGDEENEDAGLIDEDDDFWKRYDSFYPFGYNWNERDNPCSNSYYNKEHKQKICN